MRQRRRSLNFALEAGQSKCVVFEVGIDELDRAWPFEQLVLRQVDLAHAPFAQLVQQPILTKLLGVL